MNPGAHIAAAAARAGCAVRELAPDATDGARARVDCPDGWGAARLLVELAEGDARRPEVRALAHSIATVAGPELEDRARAVAALVTRRVRFERETGEVFQGPLRLLAHGVGDCDCHVRAVYALCRALGVPVRAAFLHAAGGPPRHVAVQVALPASGWTWIDTTLQRRRAGGELDDAARLGEHPLAAAERLGVVRADVVPYREVTTMSGIGVDGGTTYRMRCLVQTDTYDLPDRPESCVRAALEALGFEVGSVWISRTSLPEGWDDGGGELPPLEGQTWGLETTPAGWLAWAEATYTEPDCRVLDPATAPVSLVVTSVRARELAPPEPTAPPAPAPEGIGGVDVTLTRDIESGYFSRLRAMCDRLGIAPEDALLVFTSESGHNPHCVGTFPPSSCHRPEALPANAVAAGLNQMTRVALDEVGFEVGTPLVPRLGRYASLSASAQLEWIEKMFRAVARAFGGVGVYRDRGPAMLYIANAFPAFLGAAAQGPDVPLARAGTSAYAGNAAFDRGGKGYITRRDFEAHVAQKKHDPRYKELVARLRAEGGSIPLAAVLPFVALALALWYTKGA